MRESFPLVTRETIKKRKKGKENDVKGDESIAGKVTLKPWRAETETRRKGRIVKSATYFLATNSPSTGDKKKEEEGEGCKRIKIGNGRRVNR